MSFQRLPDSKGELPQDVAEFERLLLDKDANSRIRQILSGGSDVIVVRVPGRLDVMGGIADYSGSVVCEGTLGEALVLGIQERDDRDIAIYSDGINREGLATSCRGSLYSFYEEMDPRPYEEVGFYFSQQKRTSWAAYIAGAIPVLARETGARFTTGMNIAVRSSIPHGSGISSSAAIEVATMHAINLLFSLDIEGPELARLAQVVENRVVGAPCGIMDQMVTTLGKQGHFLEIDCRSGEVVGPVHLPERCTAVGINSRVKHSVGGSNYTDARVATFMGHRIILALMHERGDACENEDPMNGYLANLAPDQFAAKFEKDLPEEMTGRDFMDRYGETCDPVTCVDPERTYRVRSCAAHPVHENARVREFIDRIREADESDDDSALVRAGELMYASHASYRDNCGLDCDETYLLVQLARELGVEAGVFGAKITGGGSGGTVALLCRADKTEECVKQVTTEYAKRTGIEPDVFSGTSPGALEFGHVRYTRA